MTKYSIQFLLPLTCVLALLSGCGPIKRVAIKSVADTLSSPDGGVLSRHDDLQLVGDAAPFGLVTFESLLESIPRHVPLLVATCSNYTQYSYAFVEFKADEIKDHDNKEYRRLNDRALRLYLRARDYCMRALEERFKSGIRVKLLRDPQSALAKAKKEDVPLLYWSAASWGKAVSLGIGRPDLAGDLHVVRGIAMRALELDPEYSKGALHELMISLDSLDEIVGGSEASARAHFAEAIYLQLNAPQAGPYVSLAEGIALKKKDRMEFEQLLHEAMAIDADTHPDVRILNLVAQRRARFLLDRIDKLFPN